MQLPLQPSGLSRRAFTLVELMVVIVLVAIMSALIVPEMAGTYADAKLKATARRLIALCSFANSQAISFNQTQRIRFDQRSRRYRLESGAKEKQTRTAARWSNELDTEGSWDESIRLRILESPSQDQTPAGAETQTTPTSLAKPENATSEDGFDTLVFHTDGTASPRRLSLEDPSGARLILDIDAITSRVRISTPQRR